MEVVARRSSKSKSPSGTHSLAGRDVSHLNRSSVLGPFITRIGTTQRRRNTGVARPFKGSVDLLLVLGRESLIFGGLGRSLGEVPQRFVRSKSFGS